MDGGRPEILIDKADHSLTSLLDLEGWAGGNAIISYERSIFKVGEEPFLELSDLDFVKVNHDSCLVVLIRPKARN